LSKKNHKNKGEIEKQMLEHFQNLIENYDTFVMHIFKMRTSSTMWNKCRN